MIINLELLKSLNACDEGIERFIEHFNGTLEIPDDITEYAVCDELFWDLIWLVKNLYLSIKCINKDTGYWIKYEYDSNYNLTYYESYNGVWFKSEYDSNNNKTYHEKSNGFWEKIKYDSNHKQTYYEDSNEYWEKAEYDSNNNLTYYENSHRVIKGTKGA